MRIAPALLSLLSVMSAAQTALARMTSRSELVRTVSIDPDPSGHHHMTVVFRGMDGERRRLRFLVDTGATSVSVRESDLKHFAYLAKPKPGAGISVADGRTVSSSFAFISGIYIGPIQLHIQRINVLPDQSLQENLFGMSSLQHLIMRMENKRLVLIQKRPPLRVSGGDDFFYYPNDPP